jgi:hypothetical protein
MTAPRKTPHPSWSLPFKYHDGHPASLNDRQEWAIERLVSEYSDTGDEDWFRMIEDHRSDWKCAQVWEAVDRLCALSEARDAAEDQGRGAREVATAEYVEQLAKIAHRPGQKS